MNEAAEESPEYQQPPSVFASVGQFGVTPGPGGRHGAMGTHNRLLRLRGPRADSWPRAYLEIIAIDPEAPAPARRRWSWLKARRSVHWASRT